jgi:integrase
MIDGKDNPLYLTLTKDIEEHAAGTIRSALKVLPTTTTYTLDALKGVKKRPRGTRKGWWLKNDETTRLLRAIEEPHVLLFTVLELQCGGRPEALVRYTKTDRIRYENNVIEMYETKRMAYTPRKFHPQTMLFVKRYISDMNIGFGERLLPEDGEYYTDRLKYYGKKLGIPLLETKGAGAYILRHTFATQACEHGVSLDVVLKQGGWAEGEVRSLLAHYVEILEEKMDRELLGVVTEKPKTFNEWIEQFIPVWEKRYGEIRKISLRK